MTVPKVEIPDYLNNRNDKQREPSALAVLDQFADRLPAQTGGYVAGRVVVAPYLGNTRYTFYLLIPLVNDYMDSLFYVWNQRRGADYPVSVLPTGSRQEDAVSCASAASLTEHLNQLFRQSWVNTRIQQWIELAQDRAPRGDGRR